MDQHVCGQGGGAFELLAALLALECAFVATRGRRIARSIHHFGLVHRITVAIETVGSDASRTDQRREHFATKKSQ